MPAEVIELSSSPAAPVAIVNKPAPRISKALSYEASRPPSLPVEISDDEDNDYDLPPAPKALGTEVNQPPRRAPVSSILPPLSDDSDGEVEPLKAGNTIAVSKTNNTLREATGAANVGRTTNSLMSNFNFDALDDPFLSDGPASKKARLSPSLPPALPKASGCKRATSNIESLRKGSTNGGTSRVLRRSSTLGAVPESDPIVATSSPDPFADAARMRGKRVEKAKEAVEDDDFVDLDSSPVKKASRQASNDGHPDSASDSDDLPDFKNLTAKAKTKAASGRSSKSALAKYNVEREKERKAADKAEKARTKEADKIRKAREKEEEKERKQLEKVKAAEDKKVQSDLAKLNKVQTDKKVTSIEMIVDLPSSLDSIVAGTIQRLLKPLKIEHSQWQSEDPIIKWRRKVAAEWSEQSGQFEPVQEYIKNDNHVMYYITSEKFVDLVRSGEGSDLDAHVLKLKTRFEDCTVIIYLIEGLMPWRKKNRNIKNRQFNEAVRSHAPEHDGQSASQGTKRKTKEEEYVDDDLIEDALLRLQVVHKALIHHTNVRDESEEWVLAFTQHISTIPYKYVSPPFPFSFPCSAHC